MSSRALDDLGDAQPLRTHVDGSVLRTVFDPVQIALSGTQCGDLNRASKMEWLLTNGLGGYSMSTIVGMNTRRHHGLLVAATRSPGHRLVVLSRMEERILIPGAERALDTAFYPGVVHPRGYEYLQGFKNYPSPVWTYQGDRWKLEKQVDLVAGENTVIITYRLLEVEEPLATNKGTDSATDNVADKPTDKLADKPTDKLTDKPAVGGKAARSQKKRAAVPLNSIKLRLRPLFAFRESHQLSTKSDKLQKTFGVRNIDGRGSVVRCTPYADWDPVYLVCRTAEFREKSDWYSKVEYPQERYRGFDYREDLWSYGEYEVILHAGESIQIVCTLHSPETHQSNWNPHKETERRVKVMATSPDESVFARRLTLAADQFIVRRESEATSIMAGYPWHADHVRDTMIALPGLTLVTGRYREAKSILRSYARALDRGLLPNRFPDTQSRTEFESVDATLWFFVAIFKYLQYTGDFEFVKTELRIPLLEIMRYLEEGTRFGIRVDDRDGLLTCGEPGLSLTWMDAKVDDKALTPRTGKTVEINALWYNALKLMERLAERFSIPNDMARFARRAEQVEENFLRVFWNDKRGCLYDVVHGVQQDASVRPNQILALSLPFPLLDSESAASMVQLVADRLLVPMGLRTLEPGHVAYSGEYDGSRTDRARARHQGSAWTWLLGSYVTALVKAKGADARVEAGRLLQAAEKHLSQDGLGQISEISWGDAPHWPRGAPAHATAVAELLRAYYEDILGQNPALRADDVWRRRR
jgi:predicted glycogen debranching enzyme